MEKNTMKPANAAQITMAFAMSRTFVEFFLMSLLDTYFPPPIKQGLRKTAFLGLLAAIFAEIPVDSIWLSAN
jgi:hypothetical protein